MLALINILREYSYSRDPFSYEPKKPCLAKLLLSVTIGLLGFAIALKVLLSLETLCLPTGSKNQTGQNSCLISQIL